MTRLLFLCLLFSFGFCHICLLYPPQRGGYSIETPGDYSCFQPEAPCGTEPASEPQITLVGGQLFYVLLQQNLNHYNPGWPGFLQVSYAVGHNQTADDQFTSLYAISDYWAHFQGTQTNFSIPIQVPNIDCDWCTLQVRYHPNKPTEPIFHNCADVKIVQSTSSTPTGRLIGVAKIGNEYPGSSQYASLIDIDPMSGMVERTFDIASHIGVRSIHEEIFSFNPPSFFIGNGLITPAKESDSVLFFGQESSNSALSTDSPYDELFQLNISSGSLSHHTIALPSGINQWDAIISTYSSNTPYPYILIGQTEDSVNNIYTYSAYWLSDDLSSISSVIGTTSPDMTFVNFLWAEFNPCAGSSGRIYVLAGDENSLTALNVKLYTFDIATSSVSSVKVDNSRYTISSIHAWPSGDCNNLYSLSPGLVEQYPSSRVWSLITIDPTSGFIPNAANVTAPGEYTQYYGGGVYGKAVTSDNILYHVFRREVDHSFELAKIDLSTSSIQYTTGLNMGVNSEIFISSLTFVPDEFSS